MGGATRSLYEVSTELGYESEQSLHTYPVFPHTQENMHAHKNPGEILETVTNGSFSRAPGRGDFYFTRRRAPRYRTTNTDYTPGA